MEVLNDLVGYKNLKIYQNSDWFSFSLDSVLLPNFVNLRSSTKLIFDFCTGNAPIPLILSTKTKAKIVGIEIQEDVFKLACKTISYNRLDKQVALYNMDLNNLQKSFDADIADIVLCNPPYFKVSEGSNLNGDIHKTIARHEVSIDLEQIIKKAFYILKNGGIIALVHRTDRFIEMLQLLEKNHFAVKKIRFIYPKKGAESNLVLVEARKNGNVGLKVMSPLYVHYENGEYSKEVLSMFK